MHNKAKVNTFTLICISKVKTQTKTTLYIKKKLKTTINMYQNIKKTSKITTLNGKHSSKEVNATSFVKHSKTFCYACKHKYRIKNE